MRGLCAAQSLSIMQGCELHNRSVTQGGKLKKGSQIHKHVRFLSIPERG